MKITFLVAHMLDGGAERTVAYLSEYLSRSGHNVTILSLTNDSFYELNPEVTFKSLNIKSSCTNIFQRINLIFKRFRSVNQYIKRQNPDVVFCMMSSMAKYILKLHRTMKFALITSERSNPEYADKRTLKQKIKIYKNSDSIIFQTERAKNFYPSYIQNKSQVIHNAVGNKYIYECLGKEVNRKNKISAIGRLETVKDYPTLIRAFANVVKKHPDFKLEIFGEGSQKDTLTNLANQLNLSKNVVFKGVSKTAIVESFDSKCYVMSSLSEGMPNALMEAMAVGLPCVSTDCPNGPAELIDNGINGLLVPVGDVEALTDAILKMIEDTEFAESCAQKARDILKNHNVDFIGNLYNEFIINTLKNKIEKDI